MKVHNHIILSFAAAAALLAACSEEDKKVTFGIDTNSISADAVGGVEKIKVASSENWIASSNVTWITVSPANGNASRECSLQIDSAINTSPRSGIIRIIKRDNPADYKEIRVEQKGFDYAITLDEPTVNIENYASLEERYVDVRVKTNVDFDIKVPDDKTSWVKYDQYTVNLDHGRRPREVVVRFNWGINSGDARSAEISFVPSAKESDVTAEMLARNDKLVIEQDAAEPIKENSREGDSVAMLSIARSMQVWSSSWESSGERMDNWDGVTLWEEGMKGYTPEKKGRVKTASFYMFSTKEGIPFEVKYLTAAEELEFYSNVNTFQLSLSTGPYICELTQLKRLTIGAYGLTELDENFTKLSNLEYLDLGSNNFEQIPDIINPKNFPKLHVLRMANNQRKLIYDLSNSITTNFGGLFKHTQYNSTTQQFGEFPEWLLRWEPGTTTNNEGTEVTVTGLDTLILSVNYFQGSIPDFEDDDTMPVYTEAPDSLTREDGSCYLVEHQVKRVMPQLRMFAINLNRLTGALPEWVLYHPSLDWWDPYTLFFTQEGKDELGNLANFSNTPVSLNYYYDEYPKKKLANMTSDDEEENTDSGSQTRSWR